MKKNVIIVVQLIIVLVLGWLLYFKKENQSACKISVLKQNISPSGKSSISSINPYKDSNLSFLLIPSEDNTWGYKILLDGNVMIIQPNKPGIPGTAGFKSQDQAQKVAMLVISKIRKGQMPPTITIYELRMLGVL